MGMNDLQNEMLVDSQSSETNKEKLTELSRLCNMMKDAENIVKKDEQRLKMAKDKLFNLQMVRIPDLFDEMGLSQIKLLDGSLVEIKRSFAASISADNKSACFNWLKENNFDDIIKHDVTVKLKKGENEEYKKLKDSLDAMGSTYTDKESVHPMTLKAFVKEQIEKGSNIPTEEFGVYPIRKTSIK